MNLSSWSIQIICCRQLSTSVVRSAKKPYQTYSNPDFGVENFPEIPLAQPNSKNEPYRKLEIFPVKMEQQVKKMRSDDSIHVLPPRWTRMKTTQDWSSVWPTAHSFKASAVPLPIRMGFLKTKQQKKKLPPGKHANLELMKIPNFLHLTPPAIEKHCKAIKQFCTDWPAELASDEDIDRHFPLQVTTCDYVMSGPSLRDPRARIVTTKIKLGSMPLDEHARYKMTALLGPQHYDKQQDQVTIVTDRCPARHQNRDYAIYLLTALFYQSWKVEQWESEIQEEDRIKYVWDGTRSKNTVLAYIKALASAIIEHDTDSKDNKHAPEYLRSRSVADITDQTIDSFTPVQEYGKILESYFENGETEEIVRQYTQCVKRLIGIPALP